MIPKRCRPSDVLMKCSECGVLKYIQGYNARSYETKAYRCKYCHAKRMAQRRLEKAGRK